MHPKFPKLLVATEFPPNASGGGPSIVRQMLKDWPTENLYWWSCFPERSQHFGQRVQEARWLAIPPKLLPQRKYTGIKSAVLEKLWVPWAANHLERTLKNLSPDIVWVIPHNWSIQPISCAMKRWKGQFHVSMHDYVDVHNNPQVLGVDRCQRMAAEADWLYQNAATTDAVSQPMVDDLRERTGKSAAKIVHCGMESPDFDFLEQPQRGVSDSIRIAYAGTILVEEEFSLFVSAIEQIRSVLPKRVELHFYGAHSYTKRRWFNPEWMLEQGNLPERELLLKLRECHWGFAPMSLNDNDPRYNRYSLPTKFVTYLSAGLPVITLGDIHSSAVKMATQYNVGLCTSETTANTLAKQLRSALSIESPRSHYQSEILRCARKELDAEKMRCRLYQCFSEGV